MVEAGFRQVFIGLETQNEESLKECSKIQNCKRDMTASINKLQSFGIEVLVGYIVGFDSDDEYFFQNKSNLYRKAG